jgi:hypothetical protein
VFCGRHEQWPLAAVPVQPFVQPQVDAVVAEQRAQQVQSHPTMGDRDDRTRLLAHLDDECPPSPGCLARRDHR